MSVATVLTAIGPASASRWRPWVVGIVAGAATGLVILGIGGRVAMRVFGLLGGQAPLLTLGGSFTVIAMGVVSGAGGGLIRAAAARLPRRTPEIVRTMVFVAACVFLTFRGLHPVDARRLMVFMPLTVAYMIVFELLWRREKLSVGRS